MSIQNNDRHIKVAASQLRALGHLLPNVCDCAKEIYANAEGYVTKYDTPYADADGNVTKYDTPYCDSILFNEADWERAYIVFRSHSILTDKTAKHVFDLGHHTNAEKFKHRKFNIGTYVVAGTMCRENLEGMMIISFDPVIRKGLVMRAYVNEGYVCYVEPVTITLEHDTCHPTLFSPGIDVVERNRIEMLWLGTQWEAPGYNQGLSHTMFCQMLKDTTIDHAMQGNTAKPANKPGGLHNTTSFLFFDLKTKIINNETKCFIKSTKDDIMEVDAEGECGFRTTVREHFLPHVKDMPDGGNFKRRLFRVQGIPVVIKTSGSEYLPWCARVVDVVNKGGCKWYKLCGDTDFPVFVKFAIEEYKTKDIGANFYKSGSLVLNNSHVLPVGVVVAHGDKVLNKSAWGAMTGEYFQKPPEIASRWHGWASQLLSNGRILESQVDTLWLLLGEPNANLEYKGGTDQIRKTQRKKNVDCINVSLPDGTCIGYEQTLQMFIRPHRRGYKKVDRAGVEKHVGPFHLDSYIDKRLQMTYCLSREAVKETREEGNLNDDVNYHKRDHLVLLAGLSVAAVMQVGNCPQPMEKERLQEPVDAKRLYKEFFKSMVHYVLSNPPPQVAKMRDTFLLKWEQVRVDMDKEEADVAWILEEHERRTKVEEERKAKEVQEVKRRAEDAEARATNERNMRLELERKQAEGIRMSSRLNPEEEALKDEHVQKELAKTARVKENLARKEAKLKELEERRAAEAMQVQQAKNDALKHREQLKVNREKVNLQEVPQSVASWTRKFAWPEQMIVTANKVNPKGTLMSRGSITSGIVRMKPCATIADAVMHSFVPESLAAGRKRKLANWVSGESAKLMLTALMEDCNLPAALGLKFNCKHGVGNRQMPRVGDNSSSDDETPLSSMSAAQPYPARTLAALEVRDVPLSTDVLLIASVVSKELRDAQLKALTPQVDVNFIWTCPKRGYKFRFMHMSRPSVGSGSDRYCFPPSEIHTLKAKGYIDCVRSARTLQETTDLLLAYKSAIEKEDLSNGVNTSTAVAAPGGSRIEEI